MRIDVVQRLSNVLILSGYSLAVGLWTLAAAFSFAPPDSEKLEIGTQRVILPDKRLLAIHQECSQAAEERLLSMAKAANCSKNYLRLKLSFLPDVGVDDFESLSPIEKRKIQKRAYSAFRAWKEGSTQLDLDQLP